MLLAACGTTPRKHDAPMVEARTIARAAGRTAAAARRPGAPDSVHERVVGAVPVAAWRELCGPEQQDKAAIIKWIEERKAEAAR